MPQTQFYKAIDDRKKACVGLFWAERGNVKGKEWMKSLIFMLFQNTLEQ